MKPRLLFSDRDGDYPDPGPRAADLERDLGMGPILDSTAAGDAYLRDVVQRVLVSGPLTAEQVVHRQDILEDCLRHPQAIRELYELAESAVGAKRRAHTWILGNHPGAILRTAVTVIEDLIDHLGRVSGFAREHRRLFRSPGLVRLLDSIDHDLDEAYLARLRGYASQLEFADGVVLTARLGPGCTGVDYILRDSPPRAWWGRLGDWMPTSRSYTYRLPPRDENGGRTLEQIRDHGINQVANAAAQSADHVLDFFHRLRFEVGFYLGCTTVHQALHDLGVTTCRPTIERGGARALTARGIVDAGLALRTRRAPVGSDLDADGMCLIMVTGANQGGKSTLLRAFGLAQVMADAGMFVTAEALHVTPSSGVLTHYRREEDAGLEHGKFDDELLRMSQIVDGVRPGSLVLLDESFSSTNEREGSQVARDVVEALVAAHVRVCFVTHLYTLSHGMAQQREPTRLFLRAQRVQDGGRSFRIVPGEPEPTSHALDQFREVFDGAIRS